MAVVATQADHDAAPDAERLRLTSLLSVLQLSDSAFPSGRYTLSHGLEALSQSGRLPTPSRPSELLTLLARHHSPRRRAIRRASRWRAPTGRVAATATVDLELLGVRRSTAHGRQAPARIARGVAPHREGAARHRCSTPSGDERCPSSQSASSAGEIPGNHAVVLGFLCAWLRIPRLEAVTGELFAFAAGWVGRRRASRTQRSPHGTGSAASCPTGRRRLSAAGAAALTSRRSPAARHCSTSCRMRHEQAEHASVRNLERSDPMPDHRARSHVMPTTTTHTCTRTRSSGDFARPGHRPHWNRRAGLARARPR